MGLANSSRVAFICSVVLVCQLILVVFCPASFADSTREQWRSEMDAGEAAIKQGDYNQALVKFTNARKLSGSMPTEPLATVFSSTLGAECMLRLGMLDEAQSWNTDALELCRKSLGSTQQFTLLVLLRQGEILQAKGLLANAEELFKQGFETVSSSNAMEQLQEPFFRRLMQNYTLQRKFALAESDCSRRLQQLENQSGSNSENVVDVLILLGNVYCAEEKNSEAAAVYKRVIAIPESGPRDQHLETGLANLGGVLFKLGQYSESESFLKRALALQESRNQLEAATYTNLSMVYWKQGRYKEAEPLAKKALEIEEKNPGANQAGLAKVLSNLANVYQAQLNLPAAEELFKRAISIQKKFGGESDPAYGIYLDNLAVTYRMGQKFAEAEPLFKQALNIEEKSLGSDSADVAITIANLGELYSVEGKYAEAEPMLKRALALQQKLLGPDHPDQAATLSSLALCYQKQKKYVEAEPFLKKSMQLWEKGRKPQNLQLLMTYIELARNYQQRGMNSQAEALYKTAIPPLKESFKGDSIFLISVLHDYSSLQKTMSKKTAAAKQVPTSKSNAMRPAGKKK